MFPLGSVLFPRGVLPLQVFEPRYVQLVADVLEADRRFGVVLIERGSEVGGGDIRTNVGTIAQIVQKGELEDDRIMLICVGRERVRVSEWLEDDPYPLAELEILPAERGSRALGRAVDRAAAARRRLLALALEMGAGAEGIDIEIDLPTDPAEAAWELCATSPLGSFDRQHLLEMDEATGRMEALARMLSDQIADLERVLRDGA